MKRGLIFVSILVVFLLVNLIYAKELNLEYEDSVIENEDFSIYLELIDFPEDIYDIKIDIFSEEGERISKIFNGNSWQSSFYYVNDFIENSERKEILLKVEDYNGEGFFEVKVRDSSGNYDYFDGYGIDIGEKNSKDKEKVDEEEIEEELISAEIKVENKKSDVHSNQVIKINAKDIKTENNKEKQGNGIAYLSLGIFFVLIISLLAYKNYRDKKKDGII